MRWEDLFADMVGQLDALVRSDVEDEVAELAVAAIAQTRLADRLRARHGATLTVRLVDASTLSGEVVDVAPAWVLIGQGLRRWLVPATAIALAWPLGAVAPEPGRVEQRLGLGHALRALASEHVPVHVRTCAGDYDGVIVRVGADHLDLVTADSRDDGDRRVLTLATTAILAVGS